MQILYTIVWSLQGKRLKVPDFVNHRMVITRKESQSCGIHIESYGHYKESVSKLKILYTILWSFGGKGLKNAEYIYHRMFITMNASESCGIYILSYGHYKQSASKFQNLCTILWSLQEKRLKVAEYIYHGMVITTTASQGCGIYIPTYSHYKESVLKFAEYLYHPMVITKNAFQSYGFCIPSYAHCKESVLRMRNMYPVVWLLRQKRLKVSHLVYHRMFFTRKASKSCRFSIPSYGHYKEIVPKLRNIYTIVWSLQGKPLQFADFVYHCTVITKKASQNIGLYIPSCGHYKHSVLTLGNISTTVRSLQGKHLQVPEYIYHPIVITRKAS